MKIERIEVSGGFLDGLQLNFVDGLNVVIGARGAGKTSVLELIRFGLGIRAMTPDADAEARGQARAVLGDGTVTVYCSIQGEQIVFSRTGLDDSPAVSQSYSYVPPLVVSQNEIEAIGLDPVSRRNILDRLIDPLLWNDLSTEETRARLASLERRLERLRDERDSFADRAAQFAGLPELLAQAQTEQEAATRRASATKPLQEAIERRADELGRVRASADAYRIAEELLGDWRRQVAESRPSRPLPALPSADLSDEITEGMARAHHHIAAALDEIQALETKVAAERASARTRQAEMQAALKADAEKLDAIQKGAGEVGRRVSALRQQLQEREGLKERIRELDSEITSVIKERNVGLDEAEDRYELRFRLRQNRAGQLGDEFNSRIEVRVDKSGEYTAYEAALAASLQGSNLQYRALAAAVTQRMSPRELIAAVEEGNPRRVVQATGISDDRALRLIAYLKQESLVDVLLAPLEDSVDFALLDGQEYKPTQKLSMGQRCTVVLPLLLAEPRESILLDQPEDHLDNAFIVDTLVTAIRERSRNGQALVATHNANIPVLGDAQQIIVLSSDGRRGFVSVQAPLDDEAAVSAITTLMEGGREAFALRAAFYSAHDGSD